MEFASGFSFSHVFLPVPFEESLSLQVHRRELIEVIEQAREPMGFPSVMAMVQAIGKIAVVL